MNPATTVDVARSRAVVLHCTVIWWQWGLVCVMAFVTFGIGLVFASSTLHFNAADPEATWYLVGFSASEANEYEAYRWSERDAVIRLFGLTRRPVIVDLRMTSPRPADAAPAETRLLLGSWRSNVFVIEGGWRRYQVLLPSRPGAPDLRFETRTFRPAKESDKRDLGAAFTRVAVYPADGRSVQTGALVTLGLVRTFMLLLVPTALFAALSRMGSRVVAWFAAACAAVLVAVAAAHPVDTVRLIPDLWLIPIGTAVGVAIFAGMQPYLTPTLSFLRRMLASDNARLGAVLIVAGVQGLIFVFLIPPWHYCDEASHFEYAWLLAFHPSWPVPGTVNPAIAWIGGQGRALSHPPLYHLLVSLPLRASAELDVFSQLRLARGVSLVFFLATIVAISMTIRTITPTGHVFRWLVPLIATLIPSFVNTMTSVNNDAGAVLAVSSFLWVVSKATVSGLTVRRAVAIIGLAVLAGAVKNTSLVVLPLTPIILLVIVWSQRKWCWRSLAMLTVPSVCIAAIVVGASVLAWGDPAKWYRYGGIPGDAPARVAASNQRVHGNYVFRLLPSSTFFDRYSGLSMPVPLSQIPSITGRHITVGAWMWASRPAQIAGVGVLYTEGTDPIRLLSITPIVDVDTTPRFVAMTFETARWLTSLQVFIPAPAPAASEEPIELFVDGVILVKGSFEASDPPQLDQSATRVFWNGQEAVNLVRNPSAEESWPYLRNAVEQNLNPIVMRSISRLFTSLIDAGRTMPMALHVLPELSHRAFVAFGAQGEVVMPGEEWHTFFLIFWLIVTAGALRRLSQIRLDQPRYVVIVIIALVGAIIWINTILRYLPGLAPIWTPYPRYGFPAIIPLVLALAAGWLTWWPLRWRSYAIAALVIALLMLNAVAYATIWRHWYV